MKKYFYIASFLVLGYLLALLAHAFIEFPLLKIMTDSYAQGETTWLGTHWAGMHRGAGVILSLLGIIFGYLMGKHWWKVLYVEKRYGTPRW